MKKQGKFIWSKRKDFPLGFQSSEIGVFTMEDFLRRRKNRVGGIIYPGGSTLEDEQSHDKATGKGRLIA